MAQIALSRVLLIAGAGYTSSILVRNGKLSDVLDELQALLKGSGEHEGDSDKLASQSIDGKICSLEEKQDFANMGVAYLCKFVSGKKIEMPGNLQKQLKLSDNGRGSRLLSYSEPNVMGLKEIAESLSSRLSTNGIVQDDIAKLDESPKNLLRSVSSNC